MRIRPIGDGHVGRADVKRLKNASEAGNADGRADAQPHGGEDPDREVAVEERHVLGDFLPDRALLPPVLGPCWRGRVRFHHFVTPRNIDGE